MWFLQESILNAKRVFAAYNPMEGEGEGVGLGLGVRKGAWTKEEDNLLKNCIEQYGEGKWHLVPSRAGLNRCRKSCRLRWLNYLKPNIKRGEFAADEVDLIIRLHNLLGNRWSLIAGRLPGRTANDVKNYWNTHFLKKSNSTKSKRFNSKPNLNPSNPNSSIVIKPRPRRLSRKSFPLEDENNNNDNENGDQVAVAEDNMEDYLNCVDGYGGVTWLEVLLMDDGNQFDDNIEHQSVNDCHINDDINQSGLVGVIEDPNNYYNWDVDLWNDFNLEALNPV